MTSIRRAAGIVGALRLSELRRMPYSEYLRSREWQATRKRVLRWAGAHCQDCHKRAKPLEVHHLSYARRGEELATDLIAVCRDCHQKRHNKLKEV